MTRVPKDTATRLAEVTDAWEKMRPSKTFYGMALEKFQEVVKPFLDARAEIADLEVRLQHAVSKRQAASAEAVKAVQGVISAVKGDPEEGEDGELYSAMGYVPRSRRSTGLKRPRKDESPTGAVQ
jgi:hypothetical protein